MSKTIHLGTAVFRDTAQGFHEGAACQRGRKNLHDRCKAIAFVPGCCLSAPAQRKQGNVSFAHLFQDRAGIRRNTAVLRDHTALRCRFPHPVIKLDLPVLDDAGGTVQIEVEFFIGRHCECQRIRPHHWFHAKSRSYGRSCIGPRNTDHSRFCRHTGPIAGDTEMGGIENRPPCHSIPAGLFNQHLHHPVACHHTHTMVGIHDDSRRTFFHNFQLCPGKKRSVFYAVQIDRFKAVAAMTLDSAAVTFKKYIRTNCSIFSRDTVFHEYVNHEIIHKFPIHIGPCLIHFDFSSKLLLSLYFFTPDPGKQACRISNQRQARSQQHSP